MEEGGQRPLELILARNLLASLSTPSFLVDHQGEIAFYNEAAGALLGRRYEDTGPLPASEWAKDFGPLDRKNRPIPYRKLDLTQALQGNRPAHDRFRIRSVEGSVHEIEASGLPIIGSQGFQGAVVVFWPAEDH
jgi:PAS domain-containing protein